MVKCPECGEIVKNLVELDGTDELMCEDCACQWENWQFMADTMGSF